MPLVSLGASQALTAAADTTGQNTGNLTTVVNQNALSINVGRYNIWHMVLTSLTLGAQASVYLNARPFGGFGPATANQREWYANIFMNPGDSLYFYWNLATGSQAPVLTVYTGYDPSLSANLPYAGPS